MTRILARHHLHLLLLLIGCGSIGVDRISEGNWYAAATRSILNSDDVSEVTRNILRRRSLLGRYRQDPIAAIGVLQQELATTRDRELCVAIAELGILQGQRVNAPDRRAWGTTVRYAYAYLFDAKLTPQPNQFDAQFRWACDLYNAAIADIVRHPQADHARVREGAKTSLDWYGGSAEMILGTNELAFSLDQFSAIHVAYDYRVEGLPPPDSRRGLGVPCILRRRWDRAGALRNATDKQLRYLPSDLAFAATVVVRFPDDISVIDPAPARAVIDVLDPMEHTSVRIGAVDVPIEVDYTTPIAAVLSEKTQQIGIRALFAGKQYQKRGGLYMFQPYKPGRIPVLMVHGVASDPLTWLPLYTDLVADKTIRARCQFIFWFYPTGQPILTSAAELRRALAESANVMDPKHEDPAQDWTLVCGHSMGGVLTRALVVDPEKKLWDAAFRSPFESLQLTPEEHAFITDVFFFESLPFIRRTIFYSTPHRGSPDANSKLIQWASGLLSLPGRLIDPNSELIRQADPRFSTKRFTSAQGLRDDNPLLIALADLPINPRVTYHSIIGDKAGLENPAGTDGIVPYTSSHMPGAASELVVHSGHSVQRTPQAARETRRILLEHVAAFDAARARVQ